MAKYRVLKAPKYHQPPQNDVLGEQVKKKGGTHWIHTNPAHKGDCTPLSNPKCTGHKRAFALTMKKHHGFHHKDMGGELHPMHVPDMDGNMYFNGGLADENLIGEVTNPKYLAKGGKPKRGGNLQYPFQQQQGYMFNPQGYQGLPQSMQDLGGPIDGVAYRDTNEMNTQKKGGHWIPKDLHKGRCSNPGDSRCPEGSPQYNLAMTFKKHHGFHKKDMGGYQNPEIDELSGVYKYKKGGPSPDLNPTTNHSIADYNPYVYFKNKKWYITSNPEDEKISESVKPIERKDANIEAEKGEYIAKPGLTGLHKVGGKKHSEGGTPLYADGGSFIFSNDPKLAISKKEKTIFGFKEGGSNAMSKNTPAKVLGRELSAKDYNSYMATIQDKKTDDIAKATAGLMLEKYQDKLGQIAYLQEMKKKGDIPDFAQGTAPVKQGQFEDIDERMKEYRYGGTPTYPGGGQPFPTMFPGSNDFDAMFPPDKTGKWAGDYRASVNPQTGQMSNNWNAMTSFGTPQEYASQVGYPGKVDGSPGSIAAMQQWIGAKFPDLVAKFHGDPSQGGYGQTAAGTPYDGKLGVRWDAIGQALQPHKINTTDYMSQIPKMGSPNIAADFAPPGQQNNPGNQFNSNPTLPYDIKGQLTDAQKAHLSYLGLQSLNINRYFPTRQQVQLPQVRFDQINAQPMLNQVNTQAYGANQLAALNPRTASLISSNIRGSAIDQGNQVLGNVANQNVQIANQQNQYNTQQASQQVMANSQFNNTYANEVNQTKQNFDNERRFATNQFASTLNTYKSQDDQLAWALASVNKYGTRQVVDPKTGQVFNQPVPLYQQTDRGIIFNKDVANINMASGANRINTPQELAQAYQILKASNMDEATVKRILGDMIRARGNATTGQGPFFMNQQYGAAGPYGY